MLNPFTLSENLIGIRAQCQTAKAKQGAIDAEIQAKFDAMTLKAQN